MTPERVTRTLPDRWVAHFADPNAFVPLTRYRALSTKVLAVAKTRIEGAWAAYIDAVPGQSHDDEWTPVLERGTKLDESIAIAIFPSFADLPYAY